MKIILTYLSGAVTTACWFIGFVFINYKDSMGNNPFMAFIVAATILTLLAVIYVVVEAMNEQ